MNGPCVIILTLVTRTEVDNSDGKRLQVLYFRDYRNFIHPHKQKTYSVILDQSDARLLWEICKNIAAKFLNNKQKADKLLPTKGFVQLGHDVEAIIGSAFPGFGLADVILPGSSSKLRLLVINLASVPGGQFVNSPTAQSLERWQQNFDSPNFHIDNSISCSLEDRHGQNRFSQTISLTHWLCHLTVQHFILKQKLTWQDTTQNALDSFVNQWYSKIFLKWKNQF